MLLSQLRRESTEVELYNYEYLSWYAIPGVLLYFQYIAQIDEILS